MAIFLLLLLLLLHFNPIRPNAFYESFLMSVELTDDAIDWRLPLSVSFSGLPPHMKSAYMLASFTRMFVFNIALVICVTYKQAIKLSVSNIALPPSLPKTGQDIYTIFEHSSNPIAKYYKQYFLLGAV